MRTLAGVAVGIVVMLVLIFVGLAGAWAVLGSDGAFEPGSWMTSTRWNLAGLAVSFVAAVLAGFAAARAGRGAGAARLLALVVLLAGIGPALQATRSDPEKRPGQVEMFEIFGHARMPLWNALLNPLIGVAGVLLGGRRKRAGG